MSTIANAIREPDVERYAEGFSSEEEVLHDQHFRLRPLLLGAAAVVSENRENCESCYAAKDLLEAFEEGMAAGENAVNKATRGKRESATPEQIREMLAKVDGPAMVCIWTSDLDRPKRWFTVRPGNKQGPPLREVGKED